MSNGSKPSLALTGGDPCGIGLDIILAAWQLRQSWSVPTFIVLSDPSVIQERAQDLGLNVPVEICDADDALAVFDKALPVFALRNKMTNRPGQPTPENAAGILEAIELAVSFCFDNKVSGMVTAPIAKDVLYEAGFEHPGHTEFLANLANQRTGQVHSAVMMLAGPQLRTVPVTIHIPLREVATQLESRSIVNIGRTVANELTTRFGIAAPRLAVSGLNPHAGENGTIGSEDRDIVEPAVVQLQAEGVSVIGPLPADAMFFPAMRSKYDVAICMYHDQALIPIKTLDFDQGVNVTLGLPFIRTSPDHGTAFDIAGTGTANPSSLIAALKLADQMSQFNAAGANRA